METLAAVGGGFLFAVLWFDLMFDVQVMTRRSAIVPENVLASIAGYYRRVTIDAFPMNRLVALTMLVTIVAQLGRISTQGWDARGLIALAALIAPTTLALARVVPNAMRLGRREDDLATQSRLARSILYDHLFCIVCIALFLALLGPKGVGSDDCDDSRALIGSTAST